MCNVVSTKFRLVARQIFRLSCPFEFPFHMLVSTETQPAELFFNNEVLSVLFMA